eukprot:2019366-Prymnesium_polylepis.1
MGYEDAAHEHGTRARPCVRPCDVRPLRPDPERGDPRRAALAGPVTALIVTRRILRLLAHWLRGAPVVN